MDKKWTSLFVFALLFSIAFLGACAAEADELDQRFVFWFRPIDTECAALDGGIQALHMQAEHEGANLYLRQVIGNAHVLYLALEASGLDAPINHVYFPDLYDLSFGLPSTENGKVEIYHQPEFFEGYIIRLFSNTPLNMGEPIAMRLAGVPNLEAGGWLGSIAPDYIDFAFGPVEITFAPNVNAPIREAELVDARGTDSGIVSVSPLHVLLKLSDIDSQLDSHSLLQAPLRIFLDDGTIHTLHPRLARTSQEDGFIHIWVEPRRLLDPDSIIGIEIEDIQANFN